MKFTTLSPLLLTTFFLLIFTFLTAMPTATPTEPTNKFCVPRPGATEDQLQKILDFVCSQGIDCRPIQQNGSCEFPATKMSRAAFAMNSYFRNNGDCDFFGIGQITTADPSYGNCRYLSTPIASSKKFCVPKLGATEDELQKILDFVCSQGTDCHPIQQNGPCEFPATRMSRAAFVMNSYFRNGGDCNFSGIGQITTVDPSYKNCHYL